jgi:manganese oxidase
MKQFSRGFFLSAIAAGAIIAACVRFAAADAQSGASPAPAASPSIVVIKDFAFSPSALTVPAGTTVTWQNKDSVAHTVTGKGFDSGNLDGGKSYTYTFAKAGTYDYVCSYHPSMTASVVVTAAASPSP